MRATVLYGPGDIRFEERERPTIVEPTDGVIRIAAHVRVRVRPLAGSGLQPISAPTPMGHEYCDVVEEVGSAVT